MKVVFDILKVHNFMSFGDAEINLNSTKDGIGYVLIRGINNNPKDMAKSNGAGKSSIWSAISYAILGETIQGVKTNIVNIYTNGGCYVDLTFYVDSNKYRVVRYREYDKIGNDLKVYLNDNDISGKGIRESQAVINKVLPDLTSDLLGSIVIIGQGMPHKFSSYSPVARKELLEKLTKSDFMIDDLKSRVSKRQEENNKEIRDVEDTLLQIDTKYTNNCSQIEVYNKQLSNFDVEVDKQLLEELDAELSNLNTQYLTIQHNLENLNKDKSEKESEINKLTLQQQVKETELGKQYQEEFVPFMISLTGQKNDIEALNKKLNSLESLGAVCPMCGQKVDKNNLHLNDIQQEIDEKTKSIESLQGTIKQKELDNQAALNKLKEEFKPVVENYNKTINDIKKNIEETEQQQSKLQQQIVDTTIKHSRLLAKIESFKNSREVIEAALKNCVDENENLQSEKLYNNNVRENLLLHKEVINKIVTYLKRDFRGYLLKNIIDFINQKMQEYSKILFNTNELEMKLQGNDVDITFCGKPFENLSGGEKQKVDIIIQFSIRDLLATTLDISFNILVLDEIFDNLDSIGTTSVVKLISSKLQDIESVYIISHHADELLIPYDYEITIEKNSNGISEVK